MPRDADVQRPRRTVLPDAAARSLPAAAVWTGLGAAAVGMVAALVVVAVCWLPVAGSDAQAGPTISAGLLTFLAALHGGITVSGSFATWLPLGMPVLVGVAAWRAGVVLADAADALGETDPRRLVRAGLGQTAAFTGAALLAVPFATVGTSSASALNVAWSAPLLFLVAGGTALVRHSPLRAAVAGRVSPAARSVLRVGAGASGVYLAAGAVLVVASLVVHRDEAEAISAQVGSGWGGLPILLLGVLAAPNAVVAGASYLAGPGFAVGVGTHVHLLGTTHGTVPAFPLLAAVPGGSNPIAVGAAVATALAAGGCAAALADRAGSWLERIAHACVGAVLAGMLLAVLGWQAGGGIGADRLRAVGPSPWQFGAAVALAVLVVALASLGLVAALRWIRSPVDEDDEVGFLLTPRRLSAVPDEAADDDEPPAKPVKLTKRAG